MHLICFLLFFFFNDTATTEIYTLSLHDALPIFSPSPCGEGPGEGVPRTHAGICSRHRDAPPPERGRVASLKRADRKSTRLNSSHANISYAVFCLKKKKINTSI